MIGFELLRDKGILIVRPSGPLAAGDFRELTATVDPYIAEKGKLAGLLIEAPSFPGWDSFAGLIEHFRFVRDHHRDIERVAAVTDDDFLKIAPRIAAHFAHPEIRVFPGSEKGQALVWLEGPVSKA
jgi:SpoIIAA-like